MKKKANWQQKYQEIITNQSFEQLEPYRNAKGWGPMPADDKELLALLFVAQGAQQIAQKDARAQESFGLAEQIAPKSSKVFIEIGKVFFAKAPKNPNNLSAACYAFERATQLKPLDYVSWNGWANALVALGELQNDSQILETAQEYFQKTETMIPEKEAKARATFFHDWGYLWKIQGFESGEAVDLHNAVECFKRAEASGCNTPQFWNDYAAVMRVLSHLMLRTDLIQEALNLYKKAYQLDKKNSDTLYNLADLLAALYSITGDEHFFTEALKCFRAGSEVCADRPQFWLTWACLLCYKGKVKQDLDAIESSLDKYAKADAADPNNPLILIRWAEALRLVGAYSEQIDKLKEAEAKIIKLLELTPENVDGWYLYGICLCELGRYFGEESYYLRAMDKFRHALNLNQKDPLTWYGLAQVYMALGDLMGDITFYEKALSSFVRSEEFGPIQTPQFWNSWGITLMKLAETSDRQATIEEAIEKFEKTIATADKIEADWVYNYGCAFDFLGDVTDEPTHYEKAIQLLTKAIEIDPEFLSGYYNLALAYCHLGEAIQDIECFVKANENFQILLNKDMEDELAWNDWGTTLIHLAQLVYDPSLPEQSQNLLLQAEEKLMQAVRLGSSIAFYNLACLHSIIGDLPVAMQFIEKADETGTLPSIDELMHDEWLDNLRQTRAFRGYLTQLANRKSL